MIPWRELGRANIPGEEQPLLLMQRGSEFTIRIGPHALMGSTAHGSEEALAELACAGLGTDSVRVLVGGLGMGFTLAAALRVLPASAQVTVAELIPPVVDWNRGPLAPLAGRPLEDARVSVRIEDVADEIRRRSDFYDAILLDVDNGPDGLTRSGNRWLYSPAGLEACHRALRAEGILGVWSVAPDHAFTKRLGSSGRFRVEEKTVRARGRKGGRHTLWLARRDRS